MSGVPVVLASQSPRRRDLLTLVGIAHEVRPADIDESQFPGELPIPHAERLAREKALKVAASAGDHLVIAADTIVVLDGEVLGKPANRDEAIRTLGLLSGRTHTVHTAVAVAWRGRLVSAVESVEVTFRPLSADLIERYVETGEPMDKAGAYGIQGRAATFIEEIRGSHSGIVGLPLCETALLLRDFGYPL